MTETASTPSADAIATATRIVLALTGWRGTWPRRLVVERYQVPTTQRRLSLVGRPVVQINSVVDQAGNNIAADVVNGFQLDLRHIGCCYPVGDTFYFYFGSQILDRMYPCPREVTVTYVYGNRPPIDIQRAVEDLAWQLDYSRDPGANCSLPSRVTSISREGVSWTLLDPQDFIEKGRTGLYFVDVVINMYSGKARKRARVFSGVGNAGLPARLSSVVWDGTSTQTPPTGDNPIIDGGAP